MGKLPKRQSAVSDARGGVKLAVDGVRGVTNIVEAMHSRIARVPLPLGKMADTPTRGITGLVYRSVRGTTSLIGAALDAALAGVQVMLKASARDVPEEQAMPRRDAVISALNGVVGDHLERTGNPLALEMQLNRAERLARMSWCWCTACA